MKTPRPLAWMRRVAGVVAALGLLSLAGCNPLAIFYFLQPFEPKIPAPGPSLKHKKVVLVTNAASAARGAADAIDVEIGRRVSKILRENVRGIDLVESKEVERWKEQHPDFNPDEAGEYFEADYVLFLEVQEFQIENPKSIDSYEGKAQVAVQAFEMRKPKGAKPGEPRESELAFESSRETVFPVRGPLPKESAVPRPVFRRKFLDLVATEVSWFFVAHEPGDNIQDVSFDD